MRSFPPLKRPLQFSFRRACHPTASLLRSPNPESVRRGGLSNPASPPGTVEPLRLMSGLDPVGYGSAEH
jgi:hypothetical protein